VFLLLGLVLLVALPSEWKAPVFLLCLGLFVGEIVFWSRRVRGIPKGVGDETLVGRQATVLTVCRPDGQVRLGGEIWEARCAQGADAGETVVVTGRDDLRLVVERPQG
jgi:membrane protein implicated in regulation of membrane protease activity